MFDGFLTRLAEGADFALISPEAVVSGVLLLNEGVVLDVGGEKGIGLGDVAIFSDLSKGISEFIFTIFARNVSAIAWYLCSGIVLTHDKFITADDPIIIMSNQNPIQIAF